MHKIIFSLLLYLFCSYSCLAQKSLTATDSAYVNVPASLHTTEAIANHLTQNSITEREKIRALYIWVAHNIQYDLPALENRKGYFSTDAIVKETLKTRKGLCQHYAELLHALATEVGIESQVILGYTKQNGELDPINHAWNAVKIDGEWYNIDVTWAAGYVKKGKYNHIFRDRFFMIPPMEFSVTHMPFDPVWQFSAYPISHNAFIHNKRDTLFYAFRFKEMIDDMKGSDELIYEEYRLQRTSIAGDEHELIRENTDFLKLKIASIKYNQAVEHLNKGINQFNQYIQQKNQYFRNPRVSDEAITTQIEQAAKNIYFADFQMAELNTKDDELNAMIAQARQQMPELTQRLDKELAFVERYTRRWKPLRMLLFYAG